MSSFSPPDNPEVHMIISHFLQIRKLAERGNDTLMATKGQVTELRFDPGLYLLTRTPEITYSAKIS